MGRLKYSFPNLIAHHFLFLLILLLLNSNTINSSKSKFNLLKSNNSIFPKRNLDINECESSKICSGISSGLDHYYRTGDLSQIDLAKNLLDSPDIDESYIETLISLAENKLYKDSHYSNGNNSELNLKELAFHFKLAFLFLFIAVICFICWFVCCCNACCDCCCCRCCCCKEPCSCCLKGCFVYTYFFYFAIIGICVYNYIKLNKVVEGIYDTQCSYLYQYESILYGEKNEEMPKWGGIDENIKILNEIKNKLNEMKNKGNQVFDSYSYYKSSFIEERNNFLNILKNVHKNFYQEDEITPLDGYSINYAEDKNYFFQNNDTRLYLKDKYALDLVSIFGKYHSNNESFSGYISFWSDEFTQNDIGASDAMNKYHDNLESMFLNNYYDNIENGIEKLEKLKVPLENIYKKRVKLLNKFHEKIGNKIKMILFITFIILSGSSILLFLFLLLFCKNACNCTCFCQFLIYFLWNILALFMIISMIFGSVFIFFGNLSTDLISVYSYTVSPDNFYGDNPAIIEIFSESKDILEECFLGEGELAQNFNLGDLRYYLNNILEARKEIKNYIDVFKNISINHPSYNLLKSILTNKTEFINDTYLYHYNSISSDNENDVIQKIKLDDVLKILNDSIGDFRDERWDIFKGDKTLSCGRGAFNDFSNPKTNLLHPWYCEPIDRDWVLLYANDYIKNYAQIASDIIDLLKYADNTKVSKVNGFKNYYSILNGLKDDYNNYLNYEINVLEFFKEQNNDLIDIIEKGIGQISNDSFSFIDGKFIKNNFEILLNNLKNTFEKDLKILGYSFILIGFALILSIPSTIYLISLINENHKSNQKEESDTATNDINIAKSKIHHEYLASEFDKFWGSKINGEKFDAETIKEKIRSLIKEIEVKKLKINLIFYYKNDSNNKESKENTDIYNRLKLEVLGGFFGVQNRDILEKLFQKLKKEKISFILISTGSSFEDIKDLCEKNDFIEKIFIYCMDVKKYNKKYGSMEKVLIKNNINEINQYLEKKSESNPQYDQNIKNLMPFHPLISYYEYEHYYYIFHKILSFFFKEDNTFLNFREDYMKILLEFVEENVDCSDDEKNNLKEIIRDLHNKSNNFLKNSLKFYTDESQYVYIFNKIMRNIESGIARLSFLMGPMYYSMLRFLKNDTNKNYCLKKNETLYRFISINQYDLNIYQMAVKDIICFSSFTSTSLGEGNFEPTPNAKNVNNISEEEEITLEIIMHYTHKNDNSPIGMILKGFAEYQNEREVLLFPFTFFKVNKLIKVDNKFYKLDCSIINKSCDLEIGLKNGKKVCIENGVLVTK